MSENIEFESELDENIDFEADEEFEEALGDRGRFNIDDLKERGREAWEAARERSRERIYHAAGRGKERLAEALDNTATRLDDRLYGGAAYLRNRDVDSIGSDLVQAIRERPLLSAGIALGAGYLVGKATNMGKSSKGKRLIRRQLTRQIRRAVVSGVATALASRMQQAIADMGPRADVD